MSPVHTGEQRHAAIGHVLERGLGETADQHGRLGVVDEPLLRGLDRLCLILKPTQEIGGLEPALCIAHLRTQST